MPGGGLSTVGPRLPKLHDPRKSIRLQGNIHPLYTPSVVQDLVAGRCANPTNRLYGGSPSERTHAADARGSATG